MIDETINDQPGNESERVGFCQDCGKPLTRDTVRNVGSRVFCQPCLTTRLDAGTAYGASATPPPGTGVPPYGAVPPPPPNAGGFAGGPVYTEPFPPVGGSSPSPVLAGLLGLIPGVGAMYNGQFAKGIAHIVIYAVLQSIANHNGILGILVAGWVFYQVFDAYHTAKARRDGMPLPDPFGLNNIGVHVGAHFRNGPGVPPNPAQPYGTGAYGAPAWGGAVPPQPPPAGPEAPPAQAWAGVPVPPPAAAYAPPPSWDAPPAYAQVGQEWAAPPAAPAAAYPVPPAVRPSRFPGAAMWLIGFGVLFLLLNIVPDLRFSLHKIFPFLLMALGVGLFVRRMTTTGGVGPFEGEGESYAVRSLCSLRAPVLLVTLGVLMALQAFDVIRVGRTWPILVIVFGVMLLLERSIAERALPVPPAPDANATSGDGKGL